MKAILEYVWSGNFPFPTSLDEEREEVYRFPTLTRSIRRLARWVDRLAYRW